MKPLPNGAGTLRDAIKNYERYSGLKHPDVEKTCKPPFGAMYLWHWFWEMSQGRGMAAMGGILPIPPSEMLAWCQLTGTRLSHWEIATIQALDGAFLRIQAEK